LEIAARFDDPVALTLAKVGLGQVLILTGDVQEGLALIDEGVLAATSGDVDPFTTSLVFCKAMCSWQAVSDYERAQQWSEAMRLVCENHEVGGSMRGRCRVHRAQVLRLRGACDRASEEIHTALDELDPYAGSGERGWIMSELGGTRLRLGDLGGAETAFVRAHELGWPPQLGLARLGLARGDIVRAASVIGDALDNPNDLPSFETPPHTDLRRAPLLAAFVEVAVETGDVDRAGRAGADLTEIAERYGSTALHAAAAAARGDVALARGDAAAAREEFETSIRLWRSVNAPYEGAAVRMRLGRAHQAAGRTDQALLEYRAAGQIFERLGARLDLRKAEEAENALTGDRRGSRETKVFMFTDIVQSTSLAEALGDDAWEHLLRWHNEMLARTVGEHGGELVRSMGDGLFVTFDQPEQAVDAAIEIQHALERHRREHGFAPSVRIGLHRAEATRDGTDWAGVGVHAAARIGALADGGEILTSRETAEAAGGARQVSEPSAVSLKGFKEPVEVVRIEWR